MLKKAILLAITILIVPGFLYADSHTYTSTVKVLFTDRQLPESAKLQAEFIAKTDVLQQVGATIKKITDAKKITLDDGQLVAIAGQVAEPKISSVRRYVMDDMFGVEVGADVTIDTAALEKNIKTALQNTQVIEKMKLSQSAGNQILDQIAALQKNDKQAGVSYKQLAEIEKKYRIYTHALHSVSLNQDVLTSIENGKYSNPEKALKQLSLAIGINPDLAVSYSNRAIAYNELGMKKQALKNSEKAIQLNADCAACYVDRGIILMGLGNVQGAIDDFSKALNMNPNNNTALAKRGLAYKIGGKFDLMCVDLGKACELGNCAEMTVAQKDGRCMPSKPVPAAVPAPKPVEKKAAVKEKPAPKKEGKDDIATQMNRLVEMRKKGLITEDEYQARTSRLIQSLK